MSLVGSGGLAACKMKIKKNSQGLAKALDGTNGKSTNAGNCVGLHKSAWVWTGLCWSVLAKRITPRFRFAIDTKCASDTVKMNKSFLEIADFFNATTQHSLTIPMREYNTPLGKCALVAVFSINRSLPTCLGRSKFRRLRLSRMRGKFCSN